MNGHRHFHLQVGSVLAKRDVWLPLMLVGLGALVFTLARTKAKFWIIDDAAITYAYARSMAHGSVAAYPEGPSVEGFSNPLLCFMVAVLWRIGLFDPITTHLWLEALLFGGTLAGIFVLLLRRAGTLAAIVGTITFAGAELMTEATWVWYGSGLENMLLTACLVLLVWRADSAIRQGPRAWLDGTLLAATALVRPEAAVYPTAVVAGVGAALLVSSARHRYLGALVRTLAVATFWGGLFLTWRWYSYRELLPNTYYAKSDWAGFMRHFDDYVVKDLLPYRFLRLFAVSALVLLFVRKWRDLGIVLILLLVGSTFMPAYKGGDWTGHHRFATPLVALSHLSFVLAIALLLSLRNSWRWVPLHIVALGLCTYGLLGLWKGDNPLVHVVVLCPITIGHVAQIQAVHRIEHQRRLGLVNPAVVIPDAGGTLLVGAFRLLDSGYLTDFHMARLPKIMPLVDQYQHQEQQAEMAGTNRNPVYMFNFGLVGTRFVGHPDQYTLVRRDLVEVVGVPAGAQPVAEVQGVRVFLSDRNVLATGPKGLLRLEILVQRDTVQAASQTVAYARIDQSEIDEVRLVPYQTGNDAGNERRAFLLSAPASAGSYDVWLRLVGPGARTDEMVLGKVEVTSDPKRWVARAANLLSPEDARAAAYRLSYFREQLPERLPLSRWKADSLALSQAKNTNDKAQSELLRRLTWDARLAAFEPALRVLEPAVADAAAAVVREDHCEGRAPEDALLCLGRSVQWLRSLGIFGVVSEPRIRAQLEGAEKANDFEEPQRRYRALVGLTLLHSEDPALQKELFSSRAALDPLPALPL